ncbi:MAG: hypothetical protein IPL49_00880 [Saprospirales bacterium]|nr:hypothetical protein [Saprospirales bacterium]
MESSKLELHEKPVSLHALLRRFYADFESQAEMKNIRFKLDYRGDKTCRSGSTRRSLKRSYSTTWPTP